MPEPCQNCLQEHPVAQPCPGGKGAGTIEQSNDRPLGTTIDNAYILNQCLGKGTTGSVYKATQVESGKAVALKILHKHLALDPGSVKRFKQEAKAARSLLHQHIVRLYDLGIFSSGEPYIAMELLEGKTLAEAIQARGFYTMTEAMPIIIQVCEALMEAHNQGVLHSDIKPANIMLLDRFQQDNFVVVLDFSISRVIEKVSDVQRNVQAAIVGSPVYMSPERFSGTSGDFRADIYSLGIVMFLMLAGRAPFRSATLAKLMKDHISTPPPKIKELNPASDITEEMEALIAKTLAKKPVDRHANVKNLLAELTSMSLPAAFAPDSSQVAPGVAEILPLPDAAEAAAAPTAFEADALTPRPGKRSDKFAFDIDPTWEQPVSPGVHSVKSRKSGWSNDSGSFRANHTPHEGKTQFLAARGNKQLQLRELDQQSSRFSTKLLALLAITLLCLGTLLVKLMTPNTRQAHALKTKQAEGKR